MNENNPKYIIKGVGIIVAIAFSIILSLPVLYWLVIKEIQLLFGSLL